MRISDPLQSRFLRSSLVMAAGILTVSGCAGSLPELPTQLPNQQQLQQASVSAPAPGATSTPAAPSAPTPAAIPAAPSAPTPAAIPAAPSAPTPAAPPAPTATPAESEVTFEVEREVVANIPQASPPAAPQSIPRGPIDFDVLHKANFNPFSVDTGKSFRALQSLGVYRAELARHSVETIKPINFETSQVLVSSSGEKPTGGYTITVTGIQELPDKVSVNVVQTIPGPSCITTQEKSQPFEFVVIPSKKPLEILERQQINNC